MKKTQLINAIALYNGSKKSSVSKTTSQAAKTLTSNNYNVAKYISTDQELLDEQLCVFFFSEAKHATEENIQERSSQRPVYTSRNSEV